MYNLNEKRFEFEEFCSDIFGDKSITYITIMNSMDDDLFLATIKYYFSDVNIEEYLIDELKKNDIWLSMENIQKLKIYIMSFLLF